MRANPGTVIVEVRDEVLELHQKGKIAVRSRYEIDSMTTLRRVYTPGETDHPGAIYRTPTRRSSRHWRWNAGQLSFRSGWEVG